MNNRCRLDGSSDVFEYDRDILRYVCASGYMEGKNKIAHACDAVVLGNARVHENLASRSFGGFASSFLYVFVFSLPQSRTRTVGFCSCICACHRRDACRFLLSSNIFFFSHCELYRQVGIFILFAIFFPLYYIIL